MNKHNLRGLFGEEAAVDFDQAAFTVSSADSMRSPGATRRGNTSASTCVNVAA